MSEPEVTKKALADYVGGQLTRRQFLKRTAAVGVSATFASQLLAACGDDGAETTTTGAATTTTAAAGPARGGRLIEGYDFDFAKLDPVMNPHGDPPHNAIYENVIFRDPNGILVPMLATGWVAGATEWSIDIPSGRVFHSGAPLTAEVVAEDFELFRNPETGKNAGFWSPVAGVRAEGNKVILEMAHPSAAFGEILASECYSGILNPRKREEVGAEQYGSGVADGTGPFTLESFEPGREVRVARWDDYPGSHAPFIENPGSAYLDEIQWVPILEASQRAPEISTGNVHTARNVPTQDLAGLEGNDDVVVLEFGSMINYFFYMKLSFPQYGFDDLKVRQAISHAIDREGLNNALFQGHGLATYGPIMPGYKYYEPGVEEFNKYDPERAKALLDEAGWVPGSDGIREKDGNRLSFDCMNQTDSNKNRIAEAISGMLAEIGVECKVQHLETADWVEKRGTEEVPAFVHHWDWASPMDVLVWHIGTFQPAEDPTIAETMSLLGGWSKAEDDGDLESSARDAQLYIAENLPLVPMVTPPQIWAHRKTVHGWRPNQATLYPLYNDVWIEES